MTFKNIFIFIFILASLPILAENEEKKDRPAEDRPKDSLEIEIRETLRAATRPDRFLDPILINLLYDNAPREFKDCIEFIQKTEASDCKLQTIPQNILPKRLLLVGPPGTGKSTLAQVAAAKLNRIFYYIKAPMLANEFKNSASSNLRRLLTEAIDGKKPCVIILDEINILLSQQESSSQNEDFQIASVLWLLLDQCAQKPYILIIGTCNDISQLPAQFKDRFEGNVIEIAPPNLNDRYEILYYYFSQHKHICSTKYIYELASRTYYFSNRQLEALVNTAYRNQVLRQIGSVITEQDVEKAFMQFKASSKILHPRFQSIKKWLRNYTLWLPAVTGTLNLTLLMGTICYSLIHVNQNK